MSQQGSDLPDIFFDEVINYIKGPEWKEFFQKNGLSISKTQYPGKHGVSYLETASIHCSIQEAFDIIWDIHRRHEWQDNIVESRVVETISDRTEITFIEVRIAAHEDYCLLQTKKIYPDGSIVIIGCSVDHKDVPIRPKVNRGMLDLFAYYMEPVKEGCKMYGVYQMNLELFGKFSRRLAKSEWIMIHFGLRIKNLRKSLEKSEKKTKKK